MARGAKKGGGKHPTYLVMICRAIAALDQGRRGSSIIAIEKWMKENFDLRADDAVVRRWIRSTLKKGVEEKALKKVRGSYVLGTKKVKGAVRATSTTKKSKRTAKKKEAPAKITKKTDKSDKEKKKSKDEKKDKKKKKEKKEKREKKEKNDKKKKAKRSAEDDKPKKQAKRNDGSRKAKAKGKERVPDVAAIEAAAVEVGLVPSTRGSFTAIARAASLTNSAVAFNTTDLPEIKDDIKNTIASLISSRVVIAIVGNKGMDLSGKYNLENLDFSKNTDSINTFVDNSFGEGSNWLEYYQQVVAKAQELSWDGFTSKTLILVGESSIGAVRDPSLQVAIGNLTTKGVKVFAFHHSQLFLLQDVLNALD